MVLISYFDGANHADLSKCNHIVLASVSGDSEQWDAFGSDWNEVLDRYGVPYLHVTDAVTLNEPYSVDKGWSNHRVDDLILDCVRVLRRHAARPSLIDGEFRPGLRAVTMTMFVEDYKNARQANNLLPNSIYELCTSELLGFVFRWGRRVSAENHHLCFDRGEPYRGHALDRVKVERVKTTCPIFNHVVVDAEADMRLTPALQLADLFAWCVSHNDMADKRLWHRALDYLESWESVYMNEKYFANPIPGALKKTADWRLPKRALKPK